ncbi:MAG: type III pantothenate kinase [Deltaproteobacteria bacterium]|nr:type III pantothenate kinase [Deltaproteobacteria bacterium]
MLLAVDIGNTNIVLGVFKGKALKKSWRISTLKKGALDEYTALVSGLFLKDGIKPSGLKGAVVSSVVPSLDRVFRETIRGLTGVRPLFAGVDLIPKMPVLIDNPGELGSDRLVNGYAAYGIYKTSLIIVDAGTAITFDYVTKKGEYAGGVIGPGISISAEALFKSAELLNPVDIKRPKNVVGKNTEDAVRSGLYWGFISLVDGIIQRMRKETGKVDKVIATGGMGRLISAGSAHITGYDEFLTLKGLRMLFEEAR